MVLLLVILISMNVSMFGAENAAQEDGFTRAGASPQLRAGVTDPYPVSILEDDTYYVDLHTQIFEDPESEPIICSLDGAVEGKVSNQYIEAWIDSSRYLNINTKRNQVTSSPTSITISCTDMTSSETCQFDISITGINDTSMAMDEDTDKTMNLPSTIFSAWPYTITSCTIDEAQLGVYEQKLTHNEDILFTAKIEGQTTLKIETIQDKIGVGAFNISATDGTHSTTTEVHLTVNNVNDIPKWNYMKQVKPREGNVKTIMPEAPIEFEMFENKWQEYIVVATDVDGDALTYSTNTTNPRIKMLPDGTFNFTPTQEDIGQKIYEKHMFITLYCTDGHTSDKIETEVEFVIYNTNDLPVNQNFSFVQTEIDPFNVTFTANKGYDQDGDDLSYIWSFGDKSDLFETSELSVVHKYPFTYQPTLYNASMQVKDAQDFSEWVKQSLIVTRPFVEDEALIITKNTKQTTGLSFKIDQADILDTGIAAYSDTMKVKRTFSLKGLVQPLPTKIYVYEEVSDDKYELMKGEDGKDIILEERRGIMVGDWFVDINDNVTLDRSEIGTDKTFNFAIVAWTLYGYDIFFFGAHYSQDIISIDEPDSLGVAKNMEGSMDIDIELIDAQVNDRTEHVIGSVHKVTRSVMLSGSCDSDVKKIIFYESEGGEYEPLTDQNGDLITFEPRSTDWYTTFEVAREINVQDGNASVKLSYLAVAWTETDYDSSWKEAEYTHYYEEEEEPFLSFTLIIAIIVVPIVLIIMVAAIIGIIVAKKKQDKANQDVLQHAAKKDKDEFGETVGTPGHALVMGVQAKSKTPPPNKPGGISAGLALAVVGIIFIGISVFAVFAAPYIYTDGDGRDLDDWNKEPRVEGDEITLMLTIYTEKEIPLGDETLKTYTFQDSPRQTVVFSTEDIGDKGDTVLVTIKWENSDPQVSSTTNIWLCRGPGFIITFIGVIIFIAGLAVFNAMNRKYKQQIAEWEKITKEERKVVLKQKFDQPPPRPAELTGSPQPQDGGQPQEGGAAAPAPQFDYSPVNKQKQEVAPEEGDLFAAGTNELPDEETVMEATTESPFEGVTGTTKEAPLDVVTPVDNEDPVKEKSGGDEDDGPLVMGDRPDAGPSEDDAGPGPEAKDEADGDPKEWV